MSITNSDVVTDALRELGVVSETDSPSAEQGASALRKLNQMLEGWKESGIDLGYFAQTTLSDTCPIPAYAELGVTLALAARLAGSYGVALSAETATSLDSAYSVILRSAMNAALPEADMSNRPFGEGQTVTWNILAGP